MKEGEMSSDVSSELLSRRKLARDQLLSSAVSSRSWSCHRCRDIPVIPKSWKETGSRSSWMLNAGTRTPRCNQRKATAAAAASTECPARFGISMAVYIERKRRPLHTEMGGKITTYNDSDSRRKRQWPKINELEETWNKEPRDRQSSQEL